MSEIDQSFLPQIAGIFYAVFDPKFGPTVIHQVPDDLITSSSSTDDVNGNAPRSRSVSRVNSANISRAGSVSGGLNHLVGESSGMTMTGSGGGNGHGNGNGDVNVDGNGLGRGRSPSRPRHSRDQSHTTDTGPGHSSSRSVSSTSNAPAKAHSQAGSISHSHSHSHSRHSTPSPSRSIARTFSIEPAHLSYGRRRVGAIPLLNFALISDYVIPKKALVGKLVSFLTTGRDERQTEYRVMGFPCVLSGEGGKYVRNEYMWNLCFVFEANCSLEAFEPVVRKCARILRSAEIDSAYLSIINPKHTSLPAVLEQLFEDLNSYSETSIPLDGFNSLEVKLFPFYPNPPECEDWHVPIALVDLTAVTDDNWDLTAARVSKYIDGVNHVGRIAQLADADPALVREVLRHMLYYQVIMVVDIFQYSNIYTLKPSIAHLCSDESITGECATYVIRKGFSKPSWPHLLRLYAKLQVGITVHQWIESNSILSFGIDPRRFVSFGIIKGFLRRVHRYPIMLERKTPLIGHSHYVSNVPSGLGPGTSGVRRRVEFKAQYGSGSGMGSGHYEQYGRYGHHAHAGAGGGHGSATTLSISTKPGESAFLTRSGPGDSTFTLRSSEGSHAHSHSNTQQVNPSTSASAPLGVSPSSIPARTPPQAALGKSPGRRPFGLTAMRESHLSLGRDRDRERERTADVSPHIHHTNSNLSAAHSDGHSNTHSHSHSQVQLRVSGAGGGGGAGHSGFARRTNLKGPAARAKEAEERRFEEDLIRYLDGSHHTDEIQVRFGMAWNQLEGILGVGKGEVRDGKGRKGVALMYR